MKNTIGLIFLFAGINVSLSSSIREFEFLKSLYPHEDIPKIVLTSMVTRRIDQVKTLCAKEWIAEDYKTFLNASVQALQLLLDSMDSNDTQIGYLFEPYSYIVNLLNEAKSVTRTFYNSTLQSSELLTETINANDDQYGDLFESYSDIVKLITDVNDVMKFYNNDYLTVNSSSNFTRDELEAMMEAYIGDIEMVRKCEVSLGRSVRVNLRIVEIIKSLSNGLQKYVFFNDDESLSFSRKVINICLSRFKLLLNQFTDIFIHYQL